MVLHGTDVYAWRRLVRRVRLGPSVKLVAMTLADYANPDGTSIRPGNERLAAVTELSDSTIRRALAKLRTMGLIERTFEGSKKGRRGLADEYRLTIDDSPSYVAEMLPPSELPGEAVLLPSGSWAETPVTSTGDEAGTPVTVTGDAVDNPVDNSGSPVTGSGDQPSAETGTPVTVTRTPVPVPKNTAHGDRPPNQAPKQLTPTNNPDGFRDQRAEVEVPAAILNGTETNDLDVNGRTAANGNAPTTAATHSANTCPNCGVLLDPDGTCIFGHPTPRRKGMYA